MNTDRSRFNAPALLAAFVTAAAVAGLITAWIMVVV